jgi:hypothetical protein
MDHHVANTNIADFEEVLAGIGRRSGQSRIASQNLGGRND